MKKTITLAFTLIICIGFSISSRAQNTPLTTKEAEIHNLSPEEEAAELAKKTANPLAAIISLPVQFNFNFGLGEHDRFQMVTNLMPAIPMRMNDKINVLHRTIIPIMYQPDVYSETGGTTGIGNINYSAFFTPAKLKKFVWGIGPALNIPSRSNNMLGSPEFGIGPTVIALVLTGNWAVGFTANNVFSYENSNLNQLFSQVFVVYTFPSAWFVQMMPTITANWNAADGEQWSIPLGANVGKVVMFGKQPIKFIGGGGYFVEAPQTGPQWQMFFQTVFLFPRKG